MYIYTGKNEIRSMFIVGIQEGARLTTNSTVIENRDRNTIREIYLYFYQLYYFLAFNNLIIIKNNNDYEFHILFFS